MATDVLEHWCGGAVRAMRDHRVGVLAGDDRRVRLRVSPSEPVAHRHVRLMHGRTILSHADIWYVPGLLSPAINAKLETSDTPFGRLIASLTPSRTLVSCDFVDDGDVFLVVRALIIGADGAALGEVAERYTFAALGPGR